MIFVYEYMNIFGIRSILPLPLFVVPTGV